MKGGVTIWPLNSIEAKLDQIQRSIDNLTRKVNKLMAGQEELDQAIADLTSHTTALDTAVQGLIDKINASAVAADFTDEVAALNAARDNVQAATDAANTILNPPPAT